MNKQQFFMLLLIQMIGRELSAMQDNYSLSITTSTTTSSSPQLLSAAASQTSTPDTIRTPSKILSPAQSYSTPQSTQVRRLARNARSVDFTTDPETLNKLAEITEIARITYYLSLKNKMRTHSYHNSSHNSQEIELKDIAPNHENNQGKT